MNFPLLSPEYIETFILAFVRIGAMMAMMPLFGDALVPGSLRWGLALLITLMLFPLIRTGIVPSSGTDLLPLLLKIAGELLIGVLIGFLARFIFAGIQLAGEMVGFQMGFSVANVIDPISNVQISTIAEVQYLLGVLLFLVCDGHHIFIAAIVESYQRLQPSSFHFSSALLEVLLRFSKDIFIIAVKLSAPVMAVLLFANVAMGIVARTVPQLNVFIVSFPLQIALGLIFLGMTAPVFVRLSQGFFGGLAGQISLLLRLM